MNKNWLIKQEHTPAVNEHGSKLVHTFHVCHRKRSGICLWVALQHHLEAHQSVKENNKSPISLTTPTTAENSNLYEQCEYVRHIPYHSKSLQTAIYSWYCSSP